MRQSPDSRAYTLVEMLVVVGIFGLMAGMVVVRMDSRLPAYRLRAAARELAATVSWARSESIGGARALAVHYDLFRGEYWTEPADSAGVPPAAPGQPPRRRRLPEGVRFSDVAFAGGDRAPQDAVVVAFSDLGACEGHWVHLTDTQKKNSFTIEVLPLATQVNLYDKYRKPNGLLPE